MATALENLTTRRNAICAELAAGETPGGQSFRQPTLSIDGETVNTDAYVDRLYRELGQINMALSTIGGPWEVIAEGTT